MSLPPARRNPASGKLERIQQILREFRPDIGPFFARHLRDIGAAQVSTAIGGHGVVGIMRNGDGKTILLRAELDALPIEEQTGLPYASKARTKDREGRDQPVMHTCGHDVHIACVLATRRLLRSAVQHWSGTVVAVFQPDEETPTGAQAMIDDGLYPLCPRPDVMLAQHVGMSKAGLVAVRAGPVLPASDYLELTLVSSGPGANPPERPDPVNLAAHLLTRFQAMMVTEIGSETFSSLVCRDLHAGQRGDLFTNRSEMRLEIKTTEASTRDRIFAAIKSITRAECDAIYGGGLVRASFKWNLRAPVTQNDTMLAEALQDSFGRHFGERFWVPPMDIPVEDFSLLSGPEPVPFVYWKLGSTEPAKWDEAVKKGGNILEHLPTNHSPKFAPDAELTISTGMEAMSLATLLFL
ncbi:metal-dependent amidase/aminoacylase/carboxypeptidase [Lasiosphaeria ovina]|uniref:Metal-dependent amidase/aminoacylase/carboxypeptidase n=1 Tax=Lasiosphaeria ovina TaxID=92902 RepID=A0AAE0JZR0_9PEZI|nr:metal-dependent amidase/aminoacylase/carboxypeptidase [Lasiosphaeria ovina]